MKNLLDELYSQYCQITPQLQVQQLIVSSRAEVESLAAQAEAHRSELADLQSDAMRIQKDYDTMISWANLYVTASRERKKMILHQLIHKVEVGRDYKINVQFNISYRQYQEMFFGAESAEGGDANASEAYVKKLG